MILSTSLKTFEISKLGHYKSDTMKLDPDMYHLNTFHVSKNQGVKKWAGGLRKQKTNKKCSKINEILTLI